MKRFIFVLAIFALCGPVRSQDNNQFGTASTTTITAGGTSQQVFAANPRRRVFMFQNLSAETLYLNFGTNASSTARNSVAVVAGALYESPPNYCPTTTINVVGATTGSAFMAKQGGF